MRRLNENLLVQFSVLGGVIVIVLGAVISTVVTSRLNRDLAALEEGSVASFPRDGGQSEPRSQVFIADLERDLRNLRSVTYGTVGGGIVISYVGQVFIVWRGWRTITHQRRQLQEANAELESRVEGRVEELRTVNRRLALEVATRQRAENDLRRSRQRITNTEEATRKKIAEMLHGTVQTSLLLAWHRLGECAALLDSDVDQAGTLLSAIRDEIDRIREHEVRQASHLLHPSIIRVGLLPAVRSLAASVRDDLRVTVAASPEVAELDNPADNRIPEDARLVVYRLVEEGLNNVRRHARASSATIDLAIVDGGQLRVSLEDDGCGFDTSQVRLGLGLNSVADRVGVAGGTWDVTSAKGRGTRLSVWLPLSSEPLDAPTPPSSAPVPLSG